MKRIGKDRLGGKSCRVVESTSTTTLPLPPELVSGILERLPVRYLRRASAVCKAWKEQINSPEFVRAYNVRWKTRERMEAPNLALVSCCISDRQPSVAFSTELKRWVRVPSLFLEGNRCNLVASAKGLYVLVVIQLVVHAPSQLVLSNPATGAIKWLPPMLRHNSHGFLPGTTCVHLEIIDSEEGAGNGYRITCIEESKQCVEVYDSRVGSWSLLEAPSVASIGCRGCLLLVPTVVHRGNVYFLARGCSGFQTVVSFNLEDRKWRLVYEFARAIPVYLAVCDDKLVCVVLGTKELKEGCGHGGTIFVLDPDKKSLVQETILPRRFLHRMLRDDGHCVSPMVGAGHYLCSIAPDLEVGKIVAYDFSTKRWDEWPASPVPHRCAFFGTLTLVDIQLGLLSSG